MVKNKFGRSLTKQMHERGRGASDRHTTDTYEDFSRLPIRSITEETGLSEFLSIAELANSDFTAQKKNLRLLSKSEVMGIPSASARSKCAITQASHKEFLKVPRRPKWNRDMSSDELVRLEKESFLEWRKSLAKLEETDGILLTPFEKNLEFWRQLWRVVERSDVLVQIVDARQPLLYYCADLDVYAHEVDPDKVCVLLINKSDLLSEQQRLSWQVYFASIGVQALFWSATDILVNDATEVGDTLELSKIDPSCPQDSVHEANILDDDLSDRTTPTAGNSTYVSCSGSESENEFMSSSSESGANCDEKIVEVTPDDGSDRGESKVGSNEQRPVTVAAGAKDFGSTSVLSPEELLDVICSKIYPVDRPRLRTEYLTVGFVGYPNVGKSSTLNALTGRKKAAVSATPGRTKHFQTLYVRPDLMLCDCPGLVMPSFVHSKADLVVAGILSIDEMRDCLSPIGLVCEQIPRNVLELMYGINLPIPHREEPSICHPTAPTPHQLLAAHAYMHGFVTSKGNPNYDRSARLILKDYTQGRLLYCHPPPNIDSKEFQFLGRTAGDQLPPSLSHLHPDKQLRFIARYQKQKDKEEGKPEGSLISAFDRMVFSEAVKPVGHVRTKKGVLQPIAAGNRKSNSDEDDTHSVSSTSSWMTVESVGGTSLLSGTESLSTVRSVMDRSVRKPWRVISQSKRPATNQLLFQPDTTSSSLMMKPRKPRNGKRKEKLRRVYGHLDQHENS